MFEFTIEFLVGPSMCINKRRNYKD